jgi:[ribosomal protein S18]-alanine N-acetyltransferase
MPSSTNYVRLLTDDDLFVIERLLRNSEYVYQRFTLEELPLLLTRYPAVGTFTHTSLHGFLLSQTVNPPVAWIGGFGVRWSESHAYLSILDTLLEHLSTHLQARGVNYLHYSGNDLEQDWLGTILLKRGFKSFRSLYSYDKYDYRTPTAGNQQVIVRPVRLSKNATGAENDMAALLTIEEACFESLWCYDSAAFADIAETHPYFVVAELNDKVVGYQFNSVDGDYGYLIRIAVHPSYSSRGIGARLMTEAIHFFARERVSRIMLNTQENNVHAHRLYEWFDFIRLPQQGFVLRKEL